MFIGNPNAECLIEKLNTWAPLDIGHVSKIITHGCFQNEQYSNRDWQANIASARLASFIIIGPSRSKPRVITHTRKSLYLYICILICSNTSSMCSSRSMRVRMELGMVKIINVDSMSALNVAHQSKSQ